MPTEEELKKQQEVDAAAKLAEEQSKADAAAKLAEEERIKAEASGKAEAEEDEAFIKSLLDAEQDDGHEETEEEKLRKNKDAEAARKRREADAKAQKEVEAAAAKKKADDEAAKKKADEEADAAKKLVDAESKKKDEENAARTNKLGAQLIEFKKANPDIDLNELDKDKAFKQFIDGKLLGKKDFSTLYKEFLEAKAEILHSDTETVDKNYRKANSSSGSSARGADRPSDIYSEEEMRKLSAKIPLMSRQDYAKIEAKVTRSIAYHDKK